MATLGLKEMGKFLWEGREKGLPCWLSQFSKTKLRQPTGQTFFPTFPKEFSHFSMDTMPLFLLDDLLIILKALCFSMYKLERNQLPYMYIATAQRKSSQRPKSPFIHLNGNIEKG